jgi:hypothetical protein
MQNRQSTYKEKGAFGGQKREKGAYVSQNKSTIPFKTFLSLQITKKCVGSKII